MQFKAIFLFALPVLAAPATFSSGSLVARDEAAAVAAVVERRGTSGQIGTSAAKGAASEAAKQAASGVISLIKDLSDWTEARERFTKETVAAMWSKCPDTTKYSAAICYNMGYTLKDPAGYDGKISVNLKSGLLKTDYDCFYMTAGNAFWSEGDGGYINLAIMSAGGRCTYDSKTADLTC